ncbi:MAG: universal stress protein [Gemmatimonadetes bacterium]|nr:universal stress protein [Gemmatimonadota bacterium]
MSHLVLVPLDGSEFSESALPTALTIARRWNARLEIVTVKEVPSMLAQEVSQVPSSGWFERYIEAVAERVHEEDCFTVRATVLKGSPPDAIQSHAAERDVDLVVMATHGRGPMSRFWLGSTADGLIRRSTIPILLMRPREEAPGTQPDFNPRRVLVPLDGSEESEAILNYALTLVGNGETEFDLLRIYPYPKEVASSYLPQTVQVNVDALERGRTAAAEYVEEEAGKLIERGIPATGHVVTDMEPAAGILHFAEQSGADLIAMCTHGRRGVSRFVLGSVTDKVIRGVEVPTLVCHPHHV